MKTHSNILNFDLSGYTGTELKQSVSVKVQDHRGMHSLPHLEILRSWSNSTIQIEESNQQEVGE